MTKVQGEQASPKVIETEDQEKVDDSDIYSDVFPSQDASFDKLQQEVHKLRNEKLLLIKSLDSLKKSYENLKKEFEELESKYKIVAFNSSALLKTAQAEISRKDRTIQAVRKEKDDLLFRRNSSVRTSSRLRRSAIVSPGKLKAPIVSPMKFRTPLKKRASSNQPSIEDLGSLPEQGNGNDVIKTDLKKIVQESPENKTDAEKFVHKDDVEVLSVKDDMEEKVESDPVITYAPPTKTYTPPSIQGPITMYSKRLYKKLHGVSPQKVPAPVETLKSNVTHIPNNLEVNRPPMANKQVPIEVSGQRHGVNPLERLSPTDSLKSNIRVRNCEVKELSSSTVTDQQLPFKLASQERVSPNECKTSSLTTKLKLGAQEFIKLGSTLKPCKTSPQEVIIDLRKLPKENCNSSDRLVKEILNTTYGLTSDRSRFTDKTTKNLELGVTCNSTERDKNITSNKEEIKSQITTPEKEYPSSDNERSHAKDLIYTSTHETPRMSNRSRPKGNNINKLVITPVTFGNLIPHKPSKAIVKTDTFQTTSLVVDQSDESRKRKFNSLSPTESVLPATVLQNPIVDALKSGKKSKLLNSLFGESPLKDDKINVPMLDRKSPSPTHSQIFPDSPSLDSDDPEDLVIDTTACSINSSPRLSVSEHKDEAEDINIPSHEVLEVSSKTSSKSIHYNLNPLTNPGNKNDLLKKQILNTQNTSDYKESFSNYELPDLSECFSLDSDIQSIKDPRLRNKESHNVKLDISLSSNAEIISTMVKPESKLRNIPIVRTKEDISAPPRFVPSPPQLSAGVSGLNHSENSLLNIGDTMDLVSKLALTNVRDISPLRTPDKRNNVLTTEMESPKSNLGVHPSGHSFSESSSPNVISFGCIEQIIQVLAVSNDERTEASNNLSSFELKNKSTKDLDTASNAGFVMEKTDISEQTENKPLALDPDERKFAQPQNEFKRKRPVRRLDSQCKMENKFLTTNSIESKAVKSNLSVKSNITQIEFEQMQDKLQALTTQTMEPRNENTDYNSKIISNFKELVHLTPLLSKEIDQTYKSSSETTSKPKHVFNPPIMKEVDAKTDENKSNPELMLPKNVVPKSKEHYRLIPIDDLPIKSTKNPLNLILKQNAQLNTCSLLQADSDRLSGTPSGLVHPNIILIPNEQKHLVQENVISETEKISPDLISQKLKESDSPNLPKMNLIVNKSNSEAMPSKLISKSQNNLTPFLFEIINKGKPNQQFNSNTQEEINTKNEATIPTSKTIALSTVNSQKVMPVISRENVLSKAKAVLQKLPIKTTNLDIGEKTFKRSSSIKTMAKPFNRVKYDPLSKSKPATEVLNNNGCVHKQAVNTNKELEEMPHIARINQKVRISTYQGNKEQISLLMHPPKDKVSPVIINNEKVSLDRLDKCILPEASSTPVVDKNSDRMKRPRDISVRNCAQVPRRSVSVDRIAIRRKSISPIKKQLRSKSNTRGNRVVNEPVGSILVNSVRRVLSRSPSPFETNKFQRHSRRSESLSPGRRRSLNPGKRLLIRSPSPLKKNKFQRHSRRSQSLSPGRRRSSNSGKGVLSMSPSPLQAIKSQQHSRRSPSASPSRRTNPNSGKRVISRSPSPLQTNKLQGHSRRSQSLSPGRRSSNSGKRVLSRSPSPLQAIKFQRLSRRSQSVSPGRRRSSNSGKRVLSRSPIPLQNVKIQRHSRRSQSVSPVRRRSFQHNPRQTEDTIPNPRHSSRTRNNSQYHEAIKNLPNHEIIRSFSNSPERTYKSKSIYLSKTRESDSPEHKISRRSYHQSRRTYNKTPASPPHRSNPRHYRERSQSPEYRRYNRHANPRDRSRNQHERSRSRSPPHSRYKRLETFQTPAEPYVLQSSDSYRNAKRLRFSKSEQNSESEIGADKADKLCPQIHDEYSKTDREEIIALRKELELLKGKLIKTVDESQEKDNEKINKMQSTETVYKTDVTSRSRSPHRSCHVKLSSQTSDHCKIVPSSGPQAKNYQICDNPSTKIHSQNSPISINSQDVVIRKEKTLLTNEKENSITPNNIVLERPKHELTAHVQVKRIKRKTRNLGDSEVSVVSAVKINERP